MRITLKDCTEINLFRSRVELASQTTLRNMRPFPRNRLKNRLFTDCSHCDCSHFNGGVLPGDCQRQTRFSVARRCLLCENRLSPAPDFSQISGRT